MDQVELAISKFNNEYAKLDSDTQIKLDDFILGIEEVGYHLSDGMKFLYDQEFLDSIWSALQAICSTLSTKKSYSFKGDVLIELNWEPNNFIIPPDVIARTNERYKVMLSEDQRDDLFPLIRTASGPSVYYYEEDIVTSV